MAKEDHVSSLVMLPLIDMLYLIPRFQNLELQLHCKDKCRTKFDFFKGHTFFLLDYDVFLHMSYNPVSGFEV